MTMITAGKWNVSLPQTMTMITAGKWNVSLPQTMTMIAAISETCPYHKQWQWSFQNNHRQSYCLFVFFILCSMRLVDWILCTLLAVLTWNYSWCSKKSPINSVVTSLLGPLHSEHYSNITNCDITMGASCNAALLRLWCHNRPWNIKVVPAMWSPHTSIVMSQWTMEHKGSASYVIYTHFDCDVTMDHGT